jgi:dienelactone hydrolase
MTTATNPFLEQQVQIVIGSTYLSADLIMPTNAQGVVVFAHGSGSSRTSPRNRYVANVLHQAKYATLMLDLLTPEEELLDAQTQQLRFDMGLLTERLLGATDWIAQSGDTRHLEIGYFGASTGVGAALMAAAQRPQAIRVVVSRGGRPDLAGTFLGQVKAPILLIVGGKDIPVLALNQQVVEQMNTTVQLKIVPHATHLFEEPGALEKVAEFANQWFEQYLMA